ncbi:hypothetical protein LMG28690_04252 [Paraburkholderia caffeinilytica]|nr:hypothetical protein LMG28690_04252 [Paraburkholderia caffeinilytica]
MTASKQNRSLSQSCVTMNFDLKTFRLSGVDVKHSIPLSAVVSARRLTQPFM